MTHEEHLKVLTNLFKFSNYTIFPQPPLVLTESLLAFLDLEIDHGFVDFFNNSDNPNRN